MAYISWKKLWESDFDNIVSKKQSSRFQSYPNKNQNKRHLKKLWKSNKNFKPSKDEDIISKAYLDVKLSKIEGHLSKVEKDFN